MTVIALPARSVVVLIGAAGSGKSTLAGRLFRHDEVLSSDEFRARISGDAADQRASGPAFAAIRRGLERRLAAGGRAVIDATNLSARERRPWLAAARQHAVPAIAIVLDLPPPAVRIQARQRVRVVPDPVIDRHLAAMRRLRDRGLQTLTAEGFDVVLRLGDPREVADLMVVEQDRAIGAAGPEGQPPAA